MLPIPWYRRIITIIAASILLPVLGLVLLWMRKESKILWRALSTIPILVVGVIHFFVTVFFLASSGYLEFSGDVMDFEFFIKRGGTESHYQKIEETRADQNIDIALASKANALETTYWTNFWGPNFDGKYDQTPIRANVDEDPWELVWQQPCGGGYASFTIAKGVAYTIEQRRDEEVVAAYDITNGNELWNHSWPAFFQEAMGGDGPRATPVWDDGKVYAMGAIGHLVCLSADTGEKIWDVNILEDNDGKTITWGISASPLIVNDLVITVPGGTNQQMMVAYDKVTGEKKWGTLGDQIKYSSPFLGTILGEEQIIYTSQERVVGLSPKDGALLWSYYYETKPGIDHKIGQPIVLGGDMVFASSGYGYGCDLFKVVKEGDEYKTEKLWHNRNMKNRFSSPIYFEDHIYGLDESIMVCLDMEGNRVWKGGRYGHGQIAFADGHIIILTETGDVVLVKATPEEHKEIARMEVLQGKTWNFPALSDGYLLVRNHNQMACLKLIN